MIIFPENPVWFSIKFIHALRNNSKCANKPSLRQAVAISKLILTRFLRKGVCKEEDFVEIAVITSPPENQELARKIARELLTFISKRENDFLESDLLAPHQLSDTKPTSLFDDFKDDLSDLEELYDSFEYLKNNLDLLDQFEAELRGESDFQDFYSRFESELEKEPYKTALEIAEQEVGTDLETFKDLNSLLEHSRDIIRKKINHLEPRDITLAEKLSVLDDIINKTDKKREKLLSSFAKNNDLTEFCKKIGEFLKEDFDEALNALEFSLNSDLFNVNDSTTIKELIKENLSGKNIKDLFNVNKALGSSIDLNNNEINQLLENSLDYPFKQTYQDVKNIDQYFGDDLCDNYFDKISENLENLNPDKNMLDTLISHPTKIPSWRTLVSDLINKNIQDIKKDFQKSTEMGVQLKNYTDDLISKKENCSEIHCKAQLEDKIKGLVDATVENASTKDQLKNFVNSFRELDYEPSTSSIESTGKKIGMSEAEIMSLINPKFQYLKKLVEKNESTYEDYRNMINQIDLNPSQVGQLTRSALSQEKPNLEATSALSETDLSTVISSAEELGAEALEYALSSLSAGSGTDLLKQWFFSRHNISARAREKIKEIVKQILIDLGIRTAHALIGTADSGPIVETTVIPYTLGDDFELIDLEETISNIIESGKAIEMVSLDDFLVSKTSQGLRSVVLELDISGSMSGDKLAYMALCSTMLVYNFKPEEFALTFFESNTHKVKDLDEERDLDQVADELLDIRSRGGTCIRSALEWANLQFEKKSRSKIKLNILFTDADVFDFEESLKELEKMKDEDVKFVMVVPTFSYSPVMARKMVDEANGTLLTLNEWRDFPKLISEIITNKLF